MTTDRDNLTAPGFMVYRYGPSLQLLIPAAVANQLKDEQSEEHTRTEAKEPTKSDKETTEAQKQLQDALGAEPPLIDECDSAEMHQVYTYSELHKLNARVTQITDGDQNGILKRLHSEFSARGVRRRIASPHQLDEIDGLRTLCPNFAEIVEIIRSELIAAKLARQPPQIPPLLLLGPPGIGKTHFCRFLSDALCSPHHKLCYDSVIASSALGGVDPQWGTAKPGLLLQAVCAAEYANPLIVLDELDKCARARNDDALAPPAHAVGAHDSQALPRHLCRLRVRCIVDHLDRDGQQR